MRIGPYRRRNRQAFIEGRTFDLEGGLLATEFGGLPEQTIPVSELEGQYQMRKVQREMFCSRGMVITRQARIR